MSHHPWSHHSIRETITTAAGLSPFDNDEPGGYDPAAWITDAYMMGDGPCHEDDAETVQMLAALRCALTAARNLAHQLSDRINLADNDEHANRDALTIHDTISGDLVPLTFRIADRFLAAVATRDEVNA